MSKLLIRAEGLLITFPHTHDAIMAERAMLDSGIDVRVMPMPPQLGSACGIALRIDEANLEKARPLLGETIGGIYRHDAQGVFVPWTH